MLVRQKLSKLAKISVNNHLRFLNGSKWNIKTAFDFMMASEKYRYVDVSPHQEALEMVIKVVSYATRFLLVLYY